MCSPRRPILPTGLSAYLRWIREDVLAPNSAHAEELETRFSQKEVLNLRRAVKSAERTLKEAWRKPASAISVTRVGVRVGMTRVGGSASPPRSGLQVPIRFL